MNPMKLTDRIYAAMLWLTAGLLLFSTSLHARPSPADSLDAVHYIIRIDSIDFGAKTISAITTVRLTTAGAGMDEINLELIGLAVTSVDIDGVPLVNFTQGDSLLVIPLTSPLLPGDTLEVTVGYNGTPFHESWGGFHFSGEYAFNLGVGISTIPHNLGKSWFPCIDNFTDRATYEVLCTLPQGKMAVAGGVKMDEVVNANGTITYHWKLDQPIPTYLASLAAGSYALVSDTFNGISGQVPIDIYVRPQDTNKVAGTFVNLKQILAIFEDCLGPYSWDRVGYAGTALGAMEHATNIFVPHNTISGNTANESLMAHELCHMWMGDKVTCSSAQEMWINEGWATFFGMYYALPLYGNLNAYKQEMRNTQSKVLQYCHTPSGDGSYFPLNVIPQEYTYGMSAYDRGATAVQALRFYLGDSLFFETVKAFIDEYAFQAASSYDMRDFMTDYTGIDMAGFFDNFVLNAGAPHYSIDSFHVSPAGGAYQVEIYPKQKRKGPAFTGNDHVMEVMFMDAGWNRLTDTLVFSGATGRSLKTVPFAPTVILVDPEEKMCDATTDNYKVIKAPGNFNFEKTFCNLEVQQVTDSAFVQVTHHWAPPDSLWEPVAGLRLSDYRYWRIDGIMPEGFQATAKFFYSQGGYLDNTLILSSSDTVIVLYRHDAGEDWQEIPFDKIGPWNIGNLLVHDLQAGDYALAVKEAGVGLDGREPEEGKSTLEVFPNPSSDTFEIRTSTKGKGELRIYNENGSLVIAFPVKAGRQSIRWSPGSHAGGVYFLNLVERGSSVVEKVVYF